MKPARTLKSNAWSCSELKEGNSKLMKVKKEAVPDELQKEIEDRFLTEHSATCPLSIL